MSSESIGRGKDYQRKLPILERRKLFIPRDTSGEPLLVSPDSDSEYGSELHELMRGLHRELGSQESFISITPTGSMMRGHANETSDIDITILFNFQHNAAAGGKLNDIYKDEVANLEKKGVLKHHIHEMFVGLSPEIIERFFKHEPPFVGERAEEQTKLFNLAVVSLCGPAVGPRVGEYRDLIHEQLKKLPKEELLKTLNDFTIAAMTFEGNSDEKRAERIPALQRHKKKKADTARIGMWYTRIVTRLGVGERKS